MTQIPRPYMLALNDWWPRLAASDHRGVHALDDKTGLMVYQSYADLYWRAQALASVLRAKGFQRGDAVMLSAETSPSFAVTWLALMWLGVAPVPLPPVAALAGEQAFQERVKGILPHFHHYLHGAQEGAAIRQVADAVGADVTCWRLDLLLDEAAGLRPDSGHLPEAMEADELAFVQYTSGSTRLPKGIRVTLGNLVANLQTMSHRLEVHPARDTVVTWLPLYHDMGLIGMFLQAVLTGSSLVLVQPRAFVKHPLRFLELLQEHAGTICSMPNFAYEMVLKKALPGVSLPDLSCVRWLGVGAEPVRVKTLVEFEQRLQPHGLRAGVVSPCYGLAEATLAVSIDTPLQGYRQTPYQGNLHATCGRVLDGFDIKLHPETGTLLIRGDSVARTALVDGQVVSLVDAEGYYDTRDVTRVVDDRLVILGRSDEMFVVNGENRFPYDLEAAVRTVCGETTRSACFLVPPPGGIGKPELVILFERRLEAADQDDEAQAAIHRAVLSHTGLRVDQVIPVDFKALPVTPSGKIQRVQARQRYLQGQFAPQDETVAA